jgi:hypothetical protein
MGKEKRKKNRNLLYLVLKINPKRSNFTFGKTSKLDIVIKGLQHLYFFRTKVNLKDNDVLNGVQKRFWVWPSRKPCASKHWKHFGSNPHHVFK